MAFDLEETVQTLLESDDDGKRLEASDDLGGAAEEGHDLTGAVPAMARALSDEHDGVRVNISWTLAYLSFNDQDVSAATGAVIEALGDSHPDVRYNLSQVLQRLTIADETRPETLKHLEEASRSDDDGIRANAVLQLAFDHLREGTWEEATPYFDSEDFWTRLGLLTAVVEAAEGSPDVDLNLTLPVLSRALSDEDPRLRQKAAYALVAVSDRGVDLTEALEALGQALGDEADSVRKEAVLSLWNHVAAGRDPGPAAEALAACPDDPSGSVSGNGAIAWGLYLLNTERDDEAAALLDHERAHARFGAAWAHADHWMRRGEVEALAELMQSEDVSRRDGISGAIVDAIEHERDVATGQEALRKALEAAGEDPVKQSRIHGIQMKISQKLKERGR